MEFSINLKNAASVISQMEAEKNKLNQYQTSVRASILKCPLSGSTRTAVCSSLKTVSEAISGERQSLQSMSKTLEQIIAAYRATETELAGVKASESSISEVLTATLQKNGEDEGTEASFDWDFLWKLVGEAGIIGGAVSMIGSLITGGISAHNVLSLLKDLTGTVKDIAEAVPGSGESFDWKALLGFDAAIKADTPTSWLGPNGTLADSLSKLKFSNAETASEKIACGAKWAGYTLTALITGYDNFTDSDNTTFSRRLAETVGETAVKIGEGILVKSAITAALATCGLVGAPAIAVGAASVLAITGMDAVITHLTGKDVAELLSDTAIDLTKAVVTGVGNAVESAGKAISGWWSSVTGSFSSFCGGW